MGKNKFTFLLLLFQPKADPPMAEILILLLILISYNLFPCTTFVLKTNNNLLFGGNLDWYVGTGLLMTNQKNLEKTALLDTAETPIIWVSRYGSITFNQVGKDLPYCGMNEKGLVVQQMSLSSTMYPLKDERKAIQACQWIQYQLVNCASVDEVIETDRILRIVDKISFFHFLICDRKGNTAVIEFINGKMNVKKNTVIPVLANSTYEESIAAFNSNANTDFDGSLHNFCLAAKMVKEYSADNGNNGIDYCFNILKSVAQGRSTKWSIVYDIKNLKIYYKVFETPTLTSTQIVFLKEEGAAKIKSVDLNACKFDCSLPSMVADLEIDKEGFVNTDFIEYNSSLNKKYIAKAFEYFFRLGVPIKITDQEMEYLANYPESFRCRNRN